MKECELTYACFIQSAIIDSRATRDQEKGRDEKGKEFCWRGSHLLELECIGTKNTQ